MSKKRFFVRVYSNNEPYFFDEKQEYVEERYTCEDVRNLHPMEYWQVVELLNEQQELIEELQVSDEMGWKRAEKFEKECPKELHNKKMYIKRLEYKVQKFKEMNSEQQATIKKQEEENRELRQSVEYWQKKYEEGTETFQIN